MATKKARKAFWNSGWVVLVLPIAFSYTIFWVILVIAYLDSNGMKSSHPPIKMTIGLLVFIVYSICAWINRWSKKRALKQQRSQGLNACLDCGMINPPESTRCDCGANLPRTTRTENTGEPRLNLRSPIARTSARRPHSATKFDAAPRVGDSIEIDGDDYQILSVRRRFVLERRSSE